MKIVAQKHVRWRSLLRHRLHRRMRVEQRHRREPSAIRNPHHARPSIVVRHIFHQPINRVVGVAGLIDRLRIGFIPRVALHHKCPLRSKPPANILKHENVTVRNHLAVSKNHPRKSLLVVAQPIRRPLDQKRQSLLRILRRVNLSVQPHTIAHRNHHVSLVEGLRIIRSRSLRSDRPRPRHNQNDRHQSTRAQDFQRTTNKPIHHNLPPVYVAPASLPASGERAPSMGEHQTRTTPPSARE